MLIQFVRPIDAICCGKMANVLAAVSTANRDLGDFTLSGTVIAAVGCIEI